MSTLPWPYFWAHIPESDHQPLRDVLSELLRYGVIIGDEGSGRDLFRLVREHYEKEVAAYFAPLGLRLIVLQDPPLLQVQPVPDECDLVTQFTQQDTLVTLVLWRLYDDAMSTMRTKSVVLTANDLFTQCKVIFNRIETPPPTALRESLVRLRRKRLVRLTEANDPTKLGDAVIEILPSLHRTIDFVSLEEWQTRATAFQEPSEGNQAGEIPSP